MPIFKHTFFANWAEIFYQKTIIYRLVMRNPSYDAYFWLIGPILRSYWSGASSSDYKLDHWVDLLGRPLSQNRFCKIDAFMKGSWELNRSPFWDSVYTEGCISVFFLIPKDFQTKMPLRIILGTTHLVALRATSFVINSAMQMVTSIKIITLPELRPSSTLYLNFKHNLFSRTNLGSCLIFTLYILLTQVTRVTFFQVTISKGFKMVLHFKL